MTNSRFRRFAIGPAWLLLAAAAVAFVPAPPLFAQSGAAADSDPAAALADALSAACRQDADNFAKRLTAANAAAFRQLPAPQRTALVKRFVLLEDPGKPLLSTSAQGHAVLRCEAAGVVSEMRFGATEVHESLAFIPVDVLPEGEPSRSVRFGLVREGGEWKLLSVGLLLLDLPAMAQQWQQGELEARETGAVASLRKIAQALKKYQTAFGRLPEDLASLGPAPADGISPEHAGLLDAPLAAGQDENYRFRYNIVPVAGGGDESDRDKSAGFALAATPIDYEKTGRRSFYLDSGGTLRGADKQGAVATLDDPPVADPQRP